VREQAGSDRLRALIVGAAEAAGHPVDVDRILRAFAGTVRAFKRTRTAPEPLSAPARRRRLARVVSAVLALEDELHLLGKDESRFPADDRPSLGLWDSPDDCEAFLGRLERLSGQAGRLLARAERPAARGRRDEATRRLVLEIAWILGRDGLPVTAYEDGLLARVARAVAEEAGRRLPKDENVRSFLRPAVRFCRRQGVGQATAREGSSHLTEPGPDPASSRSKRHGDVAH
jgi:hypothetical protein